MENFKNGTLGAAPFPPPPLPPFASGEPLDMEKVRDIVAAAGSGRTFFGGGYPPYYNDPYYGYPMGWNMTSVQDVILGLVILGVVFFVIYWVLVFFARLGQRGYYGVRKRRSIDSDMDVLFGKRSFAEPWRNGHPMSRMLKNGAGNAEMDMSDLKILEAIEEKSLDYDFD